MKYIIKFKDFFICFLSKDCPYSIKRLLALLTFILVAYLAVFTTKTYYELLAFSAVLLGISSYDKKTWVESNKVVNTNINEV